MTSRYWCCWFRTDPKTYILLICGILIIFLSYLTSVSNHSVLSGQWDSSAVKCWACNHRTWVQIRVMAASRCECYLLALTTKPHPYRMAWVEQNTGVVHCQENLAQVWNILGLYSGDLDTPAVSVSSSHNSLLIWIYGSEIFVHWIKTH